jgi:hypothetical protein
VKGNDKNKNEKEKIEAVNTGMAENRKHRPDVKVRCLCGALIVL